MKSSKMLYGDGLRRLKDRYVLTTAAYIILISVFLGSAVLFSIYRISIKNIEESSLYLCKIKIKEFKNILDTNIRQADNSALSLCQDDDAFQLGNIRYMDETDRLKKIFSLRDRLANTMHMNEMLHSVYVYFKENNRIVSELLYNDDNYYDKQLISEEKVSEKGLVITKNFATMPFAMEGGNIKSVFKIVRKHFYSVTPIYAVVNIKADAISELIDKMMLTDGGYFYILDEDGNILLSSKDAPESMGNLNSAGDNFISMDTVKYVNVTEKSDYTKWQFVFVVPVENINSSYKSMSVYRTGIFLVMIILGLFMGIAAAMRIEKPLSLFCDSVRKRFSSRLTYDMSGDRIKYLDSVYESIFNDNRILSETMEKNMPLMREWSLMSILLNRGKMDENVAERMNFLNINLSDKQFTVAVFEVEVRLDISDEYEYLKTGMCREYIENRLDGLCRYYSIQFEPNRIAIILNYGSDQSGTGPIFHLFSEAIGELNGKLNTNISIGVSRVGTECESLNILFMEALKSLEYKFIFGKNEIIYFEHIDYITTVSPTYPFDLEQKLTGAIKGCDRDEIENILEQLKKYTLSIPGENAYAYRQVFFYMIESIRKILLEIAGNEDIDRLEDFFKEKSEWKLKRIPEYVAYIEEISLKAAEYIERRRRSKNTEIVESVIQYINENYWKNITVEDIASAAFISTSYLYKLMKEEKNTSPVNYLNQVRINIAAEKLMNSHNQIKDVSKACGFESIQSFNRQFRKAMNCSPSEYREAVRLKK